VTFTWNGQTLEYLNHAYNHATYNSRRVEVPIARWFLAQKPGARALEIGNVLAHYGPISWPVVDLREKGAINANVMAWRPEAPVDLLVSISTVEHIGYGRYGKVGRSLSVARVLLHLRSFLAADGAALVTVPTRYNPTLDQELASGRLGADRLWALRVRGVNDWEECSVAEALAAGPRECSGRWSGAVVVLGLGAWPA